MIWTGKTNQEEGNSLKKLFLTGLFCFFLCLFCSICLSNHSNVFAEEQSQTDTNTYFQNQFPNYTIVECDNPQECMEKLRNGEVDLIFLNRYIASELLINKDMQDVRIIPTSSKEFAIPLKITGENKDIIASIIDKGLHQISYQEEQKIILNYSMNASPELSVAYFIQSNPKLCVGILFISFAAVVFIIVWVIRYRMLVHQKAVLAKANEELEKANAAKTDFLSRMSHDIRTPMNAIIGMTTIAQDENKNGDVRECLNKIQGSSEFLLGLINDVLDISKIESGSMQLHNEIYPLDEFDGYVDTIIRPLMAQKQIHFTYRLDSEYGNLICDKLRFNQIFLNLLSNAVKFTPENGNIQFLASCIEKTESMVRIRFIVEDDGIGMSESFLKQAFVPFEQEETKLVQQWQGTGLGLAIVHNLVQLMNGTISIQSELGKGTKITVEIPLEVQNSIETGMKAATKTYDEKELWGRKILLAEDNQINTTIAVRLMEKKKIQVEHAENGQQAVEMFLSAPDDYYDAILMDIRMPVMNGLDASKRIRESGKLRAKTIPILAMTANALYEDMEKTKQAGMNAHLSKPIDPDLFFRTLLENIQQEQ